MNFNFKNECKGIISIICGSEINQDTEEKAIEIGRLLAKNNYAISCGGLFGAMEAVCKGAKEENGLTIGIIPYKKKSSANQYIDIVIPVPFSQARNLVVVLSGDMCVAIGGKAGTLSELCFAWIYGKPIIALSSVDGWSSKIAGQKLDDRRPDLVHNAKTPQEVIQIILELEKNKDLEDLSFGLF
ncbi:MAG: TIGR00725 family protein [Candidatus Lokiarchaeota archaeon]|nr:TIGR00725 family protein [Candidatus Lokiarchaeota archaeon]